MNKREKATARISLVVITIIFSGVAYFVLKDKTFFPIAVKWLFGIFVVVIYALWAKVIVKWLLKS